MESGQQHRHQGTFRLRRPQPMGVLEKYVNWALYMRLLGLYLEKGIYRDLGK